MQARNILKEETQEEISSQLNTAFDRVPTSNESEFMHLCVDWENFDKWEPGQCIPVPEKYLHRQDTENFLYYGHLSPFSTMYLAPFTVDEEAYSCALQYVEHQKALLFRDEKAAKKILQTTELRSIADVFRVKGFNNEEWNRFERNISICAAIYKFSQNEKLKELLLNTGDLHLGYMGRNLKFGTGTESDSDIAFDRESWPGKNTSGDVLVVTRDLLRMGDKRFTEKTSSAMCTFVKDYLISRDSASLNLVEEMTTKKNNNYVTNNLKTHQQGLPEKCLPVCEKLIHKQDADTLVYNSTYSPFSTLHPAPFTVDGQRFSCAAQYIMYHSALLFGDKETAGIILKSRNLEEMITLKVYGFKPEKWIQHVETIMRNAAVNKFSQNPTLGQLLLRTGDLDLRERNTNTFYGTGVFGNEREALNREQLTGENIAGKALMDARDILRKQEAILTAPESGICAVVAAEGCVPVWEYWIHNRNSETFIYHSRMSPLSNMHPAPFTVDGQTYSNIGQYIAHQQALLFGDEETARKILNTTDPDELLGLERLIEGFCREKWKQHEKKIMIDAAVHKFKQNHKLKLLLLSTDDLHLGSMGLNPRYGTGMTINDERALDWKRWPGENLNGKSLMAARDILRKNSKKD